jgi:hypothetical protein
MVSDGKGQSRGQYYQRQGIQKTHEPSHDTPEFFHGSSFIGARLFHSPPFSFMIHPKRGKRRNGFTAMITPTITPMNGAALIAK